MLGFNCCLLSIRHFFASLIANHQRYLLLGRLLTPFPVNSHSLFKKLKTAVAGILDNPGELPIECSDSLHSLLPLALNIGFELSQMHHRHDLVVEY